MHEWDGLTPLEETLGALQTLGPFWHQAATASERLGAPELSLLAGHIG